MNTPLTAKRLVRLCAFISLVFAGAASSFAAPVVFNATESATPGALFFLQGDNFTASPTVWFGFVTGTETTLTPDVQLSGSSIASVSNQEITANLPSDIPLGLYAVWVKDSSGVLSAPVMINQARAMHFEYPQISPGYTFRVFGRNLCLPGARPTATFVLGSSTSAAPVVTTYPNDSDVLEIQAPSSLVTGSAYSLYVSNGYGHGSANFDVTVSEETIVARTGGLDPFNLGVPWAPDFAALASSTINAVSTINPHTGVAYGADPTGANNSVNAIQQALYDAGNPSLHANGAVVYLPTGTYLLNFSTENLTFTGTGGTTINQNAPNTSGHFELNIPSHAVLKGAGIGQTIINDQSPAYDGYSFFITIADASPNYGSLSGATGFTYNQQMAITGSNTSPPSIRNYAVDSSDIFLQNIQANFAHGLMPYGSGTNVICAGFVPQGSVDANVLVEDCNLSYFRFGNNNYYGYAFTYGSDYTFRDNTFSSFFARLEMIYISPRLMVEGNTFTRDGKFPPPGYGGSTTCGGIEATGADHVFLNNTFNAINLPLSQYNDGESMNFQAGPYFGNPNSNSAQGIVTSATVNTLTDGTANWTPNAFTYEIVWITSGTCTGEWVSVASNTNNTLYVTPHWTNVPPVGSHYSIIAGNAYKQGTVTGASSTTLTDSSQVWPTNFQAGEAVAIVNGPGTGQIRPIVSNSGSILTVAPAWLENPTSTSSYVINGALCPDGGLQRSLIKDNLFQDVPRGIVFYLGGYDCAVVGNTLASANGIYVLSSQRDTLNSATYDRFDTSWDLLFADNIVSNPDADASRAAYYCVRAGLNPSCPLFGTMILGIENRRNILEENNPNAPDTGGYGVTDSLTNQVTQSTSGNAGNGNVGVLGTIYDDVLNISSSNAYTLSTAVSQTTVWNDLDIGCNALVLDSTLSGCTQASTLTTYGVEPVVMEADFSGTGASTGGTNNLATIGASAKLATSAYQDSIVLSSSNPFTSTSGSYITITTGTLGAAGTANVNITPISDRTSWGRIFDGRLVGPPTNGHWQVNGGFDFFWRPTTSPITGSAMRAIDITNNSAPTYDGMRIMFVNSSGSSVSLVISTGSAATYPLNLTGTYGAGFSSGNIYHLGALFSTGTNGISTARIFAAAGTGSIVTSGSGAVTPIASGTFMLSPNTVTYTGGILSSGTYWQFGRGDYGNGTIHSEDYDCVRLYSQDPGVFDPCGP